MSKFQKFMLAGIATAVTLTATAAGLCTIAKRDNHIALYNNDAMLVATAAGGNYAISSIQLKHRSFLYGLTFTCYEKGVKDPCSEARTPAGKCTELKAEAKDGKICWQVKDQWRNMEVIRTIETGDYPGFKLTYDFEVTNDFEFDKIYLSFNLPQSNVYNRSGYIKNGVFQFRPVRKAEWFGILRNRYFPYITFSGDTVNEGIMIAAGDMTSWNRLPGTLLYATTDKCYYVVQFMYQFDKVLKKGEKHSISVYVIPVSAKNTAADAAAAFLQIKDSIK